MSAAGSRNELRLLDVEAPCAAPVGVMASRRLVATIARRLAGRASHYSALRVTAVRDRIVFWSFADEVRLPWFGEDVIYLAHRDKALLFPADKRLALPARWVDPLTERLSTEKDLSRPVLLWQPGDRLTATGLGRNSCPFEAVDWKGLDAP